jgi:hypothetical protein
MKKALEQVNGYECYPSYPISYHDNGMLRQFALAKDTEINGIKFGPRSVVTLRPDGTPSSVVPCVITKIVFGEGPIVSFE